MIREELRKYLLKRIDDILTGWWTARFLTEQDRLVLHAQYALYEQDQGPVLDWILQHMPAKPRAEPDITDQVRAILTLRVVEALANDCLDQIDPGGPRYTG